MLQLLTPQVPKSLFGVNWGLRGLEGMVEMLPVKGLGPLANEYCLGAEVVQGPAMYYKIFQGAITKFCRR